MSTLMIQLTHDLVPVSLVFVHLQVHVEGLVYEELFEAEPNLKYKFAWDRRNAYNQKVFGIVPTNGACVPWRILSSVCVCVCVCLCVCVLAGVSVRVCVHVCRSVCM